MTFPVGVYNPQNKKINFSTFHNGLMGGVNSNSNRAFDELFMRISLQNREFSLIIVYVGGAGASQVGHDPVYGRHTGM